MATTKLYYNLALKGTDVHVLN